MWKRLSSTAPMTDATSTLPWAAKKPKAERLRFAPTGFVLGDTNRHKRPALKRYRVFARGFCEEYPTNYANDLAVLYRWLSR